MIKRKGIFSLIIIGMGITCLIGCGSGFAPNSTEDGMPDMDSTESNLTEENTDITMPLENNQGDTETEPEQDESEIEEDTTPKEVPQLPDTGRKLDDFVPEGWEVKDSVELDFNEDGVVDYVGVLQAVSTDTEGHRMRQKYPRILFAIASDGTDGYRLDFQDINLIRTSDEGGPFGDPYMPLTAEGTSFTTHAYGGSSWKWDEESTYTYREGVWWLTLSEEFGGYGRYITYDCKDDWESGVGIRKKRSSEFKDWYVEETWDTVEYDVEYELSLDEPLTLEQAGKRGLLALDRVTDWEVEAITFAADIELPKDMVRLPDEIILHDYCDEDCVLYTFYTDKDFCYLAMYRWQDKVLSVLAEEESAIDDLVLYKGKIYYTIEVVENVTYNTMQDGKGEITEERHTVGSRINRMELDGTGKETIYEYRSLVLIDEISGDEIVVKVYIEGEPQIYRMNTDGSGLKKIEQILKE